MHRRALLQESVIRPTWPEPRVNGHRRVPSRTEFTEQNINASRLVSKRPVDGANLLRGGPFWQLAP